MTETLVVTGRAKPLDLLLFQRYKRQVPGLLEQTYDQNPGLAALGPILPLGTSVVVVPPKPASARPQRVVIKLF